MLNNMEQFDAVCVNYKVGWALAQQGRARAKPMLGQGLMALPISAYFFSNS
jgi:hypothetical protein